MHVTAEDLEGFRAQLEAIGFHCSNCNAFAGFISPLSYTEAPDRETGQPRYVVTLECQKCHHSAMTVRMGQPKD